MPQGQATYQEFARAVRQSFPPGSFEGIGDAELVHAVVTENPELKAGLIADPLEGIEIAGLPRQLPGGPPPMPNEPFLGGTIPGASTGLTRGIATGLRIAPEIIGSITGATVMGLGSAAATGSTGGTLAPTIPAAVLAGESFGGAVGAGVGEIAAQEFEMFTGERTARNPLVVGGATVLGGIPIAPASPVLGTGVNIARRMGQGSAFATADLVMRKNFEEGKFPTAEEFLVTGGIGAGVGTVLGTGEQGLQRFIRGQAARRGPAGDAARSVSDQIDEQIAKHVAADAAEAAEIAASEAAMKQQVFNSLTERGMDPLEAEAIINGAAELIDAGNTGPRGLIAQTAGGPPPRVPPDPFAELRGPLRERGLSDAQIEEILGPVPQAPPPDVQAFQRGGTGIATRVTPEGEAIPPQIDIIDPNAPPIIGRPGPPAPPPTLTQQLADQVAEGMEAPSLAVLPKSQLVTEKALHLRADTEMPPVFVPTQPRLRGVPRGGVVRKPRIPTRVRRPRGTVPSMQEASGGVVSAAGQQRLRNIDITEMPAGAMDDPGFSLAHRVAREEGSTLSDAELFRRYQENVDDAAEINADIVDAETLLLRRIAQLGGLRVRRDDIFHGEVSKFLEFRETAGRAGKGGEGVKPTKGGIYTTRSLGGVNDVVRPEGTGGRDVDSIVENLQSEGFEIGSGLELLAALQEALLKISKRNAGELPGQVPVNNGPQWYWRSSDQDLAATAGDALEGNAHTGGAFRDQAEAQQQILRILSGAESEGMDANMRVLNEAGEAAGLPPVRPQGVRPARLLKQIKDNLCG